MVKYISNEAEPPFSPCHIGALVVIFLIYKPYWALGVVREISAYDFYFFGGVTIANAKDMLINEQIDAKEIRVIGADGEQLGIMSTEQALRMAYNDGLDLVMMTGNATPPVCKIMNFGKFRFEREKKEKEAKKKQQVVELKEIQLSCRIENHDFETKLKHAHKFLSSGNKVRVVLRFKGREMSHQDLGAEIMERFRVACEELGTVDKKPVLDGRMLSMVISPNKK